MKGLAAALYLLVHFLKQVEPVRGGRKLAEKVCLLRRVLTWSAVLLRDAGVQMGRLQRLSKETVAVMGVEQLIMDTEALNPLIVELQEGDSVQGQLARAYTEGLLKIGIAMEERLLDRKRENVDAPAGTGQTDALARSALATIRHHGDDAAASDMLLLYSSIDWEDAVSTSPLIHCPSRTRCPSAPTSSPSARWPRAQSAS